MPVNRWFVLSLTMTNNFTTRNNKRWTLVSAVALLGALALAACTSSSNAGGPTNEAKHTTLNGSGSTFQKAFLEAAIQGYSEENGSTTINYAGGGSGKGKTDLQNKTVDFAGTDSLIKEEDLANYKGGKVLYFPTVVAPITIAYNLDSVDKLQLSADTLAKIFQGDIKKWNDAAVAADNPGVDLPDTGIIVAHRTEASGTTSNFTKFLDAAAKGVWKLGSGDTVEWPADSQAGQGNAGVASIVKESKGAIGYVDYSDAIAAQLKVAAIENAAGKFVDATLAGASAAASASEVNDNLTYNPINASGDASYPLTSPTWIIVYAKQTDKTKGAALKSFLAYVLNGGQNIAEQTQYAKLPASLQQKAVAQLEKLDIPA
jgi:phosphate transport system substrate-binding protein